MTLCDHGVHLESRGAARIVTVDRPDCMNALSRNAARALQAHVERCSVDPMARSVIITGANHEVFVAGGDLRDFDALTDSSHGSEEVLQMGDLMHSIEASEVPVIAAVQGVAYGGGCELCLACDLVILEMHAELAFRQSMMGLSTGWGGGTRLVERVGPMIAARALLVPAPIGAHESLQMGLVSEVVESGTSLTRALELTDSIAKAPRAAIAAIKRMLREVRRAHRGDAFRREAQVFASLWGGPDHRRAMDSFFGRA